MGWVKRAKSLASQDSSHVGNARFFGGTRVAHVGNACVGVVSMRCAPVALPTFATARERRFFTVVVLFDAYFLSVMIGLCTWCLVWFIMVLILMRSSLP